NEWAVPGSNRRPPACQGRREKTASPRSSAGSSAGRGLDEARYVDRVRRRTTEVDGLPAPEPAPASRPRRRTVFCRRGLTTTSARPRPARRVDGAQTGGGCPERDDTLHGFRIGDEP